MALFQNDIMPEGGMNYKSMGKDQLIMLIQSQKSDIDALNQKLSSYEPLAQEKERLEKQTASLTEENEALKAKVAELEEKLPSLDTEITEPGSIAEMAVRVNGVMEAAQKAADDYLAKIKEMHDAMKRDYDVYEAVARQKADAILHKANVEAEAVVQNARNEANDIWSTLQTRFNSYVADKKQNSDE